MPGVKLPHKRLYPQAVRLYVHYPALSLVDCLLAVAAERENGEVLTFDPAAVSRSPSHRP